MKAYRTFGLLIVISLLLAACGGGAPAATPDAQALPPVVSSALVISEGRLFPTQFADISFNSSGNVTEVLVKEGETVQADQVIARLVNSEAEESTSASAQKAADVATAQQAVAAAQQEVAAAQQEVAAALQEVATTQQAQLDAQAELVNARKAVTDMLDSTATALNLAQAQMDIANLEKQIDDANRTLRGLVSPNIKYYQDQVNQAQNALTDVTQNAALVDTGQLQINLREAQKQLQTATDVFNNAKDEFADCPSCDKVWAYDRWTTWIDAKNLYADAASRVEQIQVQIDQGQRSNSLGITDAQDALKKATDRLNYYLKGPDAIRVAEAQANVGLLQAQLAKAQSDEAKLKANSGVDQDKLKAAQDRVATAEASLVSIQARLEAAQARVAAAQAHVPAAQARVPAAQANLVAAQLKQNSVELKAPFAGTLAVQNLKVGQHVNAGEPMVTLADISKWEVQTDDLTEIEVVKIKVGQQVTIKLDALPDVQLTGVVKSIGTKYEEKRGDITYTVTITLTKTDPQMRWGMTAEVTFEK